MDVSLKYRTQGSLPISAQHRSQYIPRIQEEPGSRAKPEVSFLRGRTDENQREQQLIAKIQDPPAQKPEGPRYRRPAHDPCKAIIETSPYYIYFKIVTTKDTRRSEDEDLRSVLSELIIVDKDLPRTAKYRHFRSYEK